jgi:Secretion system C-terminal sorting domain
MKTICSLLIAFLFYTNAIGQSDPGCSDLTIESISIAPLTGQMSIDVKNNCSNCTSGFNGCVYWEMMVIRTVSPFDTIARSSCFCLQTPNNNTLKQYVLSTSASVLPPLNALRVSFLCGAGGCDSLPLSTALTIPVFQNQVSLLITPNPVKDQLLIQMEPGIALNLEILDVQGKICLQAKIDEFKRGLDFSRLENGFYVIVVKDERGNYLKQFKVTKV